MPEILKMFLIMCPALGAFIGYLYAADKLDNLVRSRYPEKWREIVGERKTHPSSNAIRLLLKGKPLRETGDTEIRRMLDLIRYIIWVFILGIVFAFLFGY